jgi:hypothetical protein
VGTFNFAWADQDFTDEAVLFMVPPGSSEVDPGKRPRATAE